MIILTLYTIGLVLWCVSLILQNNIIKEQIEIIEEQNQTILKLKQTLRTKTMLYKMCKYALGIRKLKNIKEEEKCSE